MFKLDPSPTFKVKVSLPRPGEPSEKIEVEYRHKTVEEAERYLKVESAGRTTLELLDEIIVGWSGVEQPYSKEVLAMMINKFGGTGVALLHAWFKELTDARLGN